MKTIRLRHAVIGIDLGNARHTVCVLNASGEVFEERTIPNTRASLTKLANQYPKAVVAMEVGTHSPWVSRWLRGEGCEVIVANPRKLRMIYENERKSDERDARMLAKLAKFDRTLLHPVEHVSEQAQRDLVSIKLRDNLVRQRVDIISSVRNQLKALGIALPSPNTASFAKRARRVLEEVDPPALATVAPALEVLELLTEKIRELDRQVERLCEESYPETARLREIRGIGPVTALCFVLSIGDPKRIRNPRDVGAYLGLVPRRDQSGDTDKSLRISKCGNSYLRRLLVGSAHYLLGPFGAECDLRTRGLRLAERGGRGAKKKAVVATARKLAVVMLTLWQRDVPYEPLRKAA